MGKNYQLWIILFVLIAVDAIIAEEPGMIKRINVDNLSRITIK